MRGKVSAAIAVMLIVLLTAAVLSLLVRVIAPAAVEEFPARSGTVVWVSAAAVGVLVLLRSRRE